jgi:hypothetical protein
MDELKVELRTMSDVLHLLRRLESREGRVLYTYHMVNKDRYGTDFCYVIRHQGPAPHWCVQHDNCNQTRNRITHEKLMTLLYTNRSHVYAQGEE